MPFKRFVETGRVAYVADGPFRGKLCAIVDVINQSRVLVDGPETGVPRGAMRLNQIHLTKFRIKFPFVARTAIVRKAWKDAKISEKWAESIWAKKLENKKKRALMTDFDRFKLRCARSARNKIRGRVFKNLKLKKERGEKYRAAVKAGKTLTNPWALKLKKRIDKHRAKLTKKGLAAPYKKVKKSDKKGDKKTAKPAKAAAKK